MLHSAASVALLGITSRATGMQRVNGGVLTSNRAVPELCRDLTRPAAGRGMRSLLTVEAVRPDRMPPRGNDCREILDGRQGCDLV